MPAQAGLNHMHCSWTTQTGAPDALCQSRCSRRAGLPNQRHLLKLPYLFRCWLRANHSSFSLICQLQCQQAVKFPHHSHIHVSCVSRGTMPVNIGLLTHQLLRQTLHLLLKDNILLLQMPCLPVLRVISQMVLVSICNGL